MSRVGGKIRVGRVTPIQQFFFFLALVVGLNGIELMQSFSQKLLLF